MGILSSIQDFLREGRWHTWLPMRCVACGVGIDAGYLCGDCASSVRSIPIHCVQCTHRVPQRGMMCGECLSHPHDLASLLIAVRYERTVRHLILAAKYRSSRGALAWMAHEIASLSLPAVDVVVPMPMSSSRLRERGFNQANLLAKDAVGKYGYRVDKRLLEKASRTPQSQLTRKARLKNLRGAFSVCGEVDGLRVLLVDDVTTTGATLREAASALKKAGAVEVHGVVCAGVFWD